MSAAPAVPHAALAAVAEAAERRGADDRSAGTAPASAVPDQAALPWIPLLVPDMPTPERLMPYLARMHEARHYSNFGPLVHALETAMADRFAVGHDSIATVANATQGLELALRALGLPPGAHVLVPTFTFAATATAVASAGLTPVLADVDAATWQLTPGIARQACEGRQIAAVLTVATFGMPHDAAAWQAFEDSTGVPVIIDAAAAFGRQWLADGHGTLVFSLHTTKSLPAGEGGLVVSSRPGLAAQVRQRSNFGINLDPAAALPQGALATLGTNAKMSEFHAAVALASLEVWDGHAQSRQQLQTSLMQRIDDATGGAVAWQAAAGGGDRLAPTSLCLRLRDADARERLERRCAAERIMTRRWYQPLLHDMPALQPLCEPLAVPRARQLAQTVLGLPFFLGMTAAQQHRLIQACAEALR
ncbi:aminotransferase class I/II-fold pyridoxal phosphate-dependent enzyme [uncultured Pseudacidovorax sp.]|uniref:DegT/DnrJ/EryC1/StrS family aminotransferase n=1 Tax=uncultured Pseudacidovorax sp. TaxID=679313 RepID=UPI0025DABF8D|nr:aminotransferase class I/II-fold pyridoxal phosphate-dependent enzyme [uncultured Pseudacidovorax sp.]